MSSRVLFRSEKDDIEAKKQKEKKKVEGMGGKEEKENKSKNGVISDSDDE